jgi:hypothetical protein
MPFVEGESLRAVSPSSSLSISDVVRISATVCRALQYAHERDRASRYQADNVCSGWYRRRTDLDATALSDSRMRSRAIRSRKSVPSIGTPGTWAEQAPAIRTSTPEQTFTRTAAWRSSVAAKALSTAERLRILGAHMGEAPPQIAELRPTSGGMSELIMRCLAKR